VAALGKIINNLSTPTFFCEPGLGSPSFEGTPGSLPSRDGSGWALEIVGPSNIQRLRSRRSIARRIEKSLVPQETKGGHKRAWEAASWCLGQGAMTGGFEAPSSLPASRPT
jgi:hypothetical protein